MFGQRHCKRKTLTKSIAESTPERMLCTEDSLRLSGNPEESEGSLFEGVLAFFQRPRTQNGNNLSHEFV